MRRFGLPVSAITITIILTSLISFYNEMDNGSVSASSNESYNISAETDKALDVINRGADDNNYTTIILPQNIQSVDGVTVTSKINQTPLELSIEEMFIFFLFAISLIFIVNVIYKTFRGTSSKNFE